MDQWSVISGHTDSIEAFEVLIVLNLSFRCCSTASLGNENVKLSVVWEVEEVAQII